MTEMQQLRLQNQQMIYDPNLFSKIEPSMFTQEFWEKQGKVIGLSQGRGTTVFFRHQSCDLVLRHYLRGGLIGRFVKDHYVNLGITKSRAWRELQLLQQMHSLGLPVPSPAALLFEGQGLFYRTDIIIHKIPNAHDAHQFLVERPLTPIEWHTIGSVVAKFHNRQVFHHDLNIHNIMLDSEGKVWLIDFDKCSIRKGQSWKEQNIDRLKRSLLKEQNRTPNYYFSEESWEYFLRGYASSQNT